MIHSVKSHGGYATQAKRRGEQYLTCNVCGMPYSRRWQAGPLTVDEPMTPLRLLGLVALGLAIWIAIGVFAWIVWAAS